MDDIKDDNDNYNWHYDHRQYIPVPGDDIVLHRENRRPVEVDPRNLHNNIIHTLTLFQINNDLCPNDQVFNC
jgi:hypothetical protein